MAETQAPEQAMHEDYEGPEEDNLSGWNCLLTVLGINLMMFFIVTYFSQ